MTEAEREKHIGQLLSAELQFRLASAVRLATTRGVQPLDLPMDWTHGMHRARYEEIALRQDQAEYAAYSLHRSATYLMAVTMKDAIRAAVENPKASPDPSTRAAYQIARLIRNAFAHAPFAPVWSIDPDCQNIIFAIPDLITLDTTGLHGQGFDWRQYGGPLALFRLCQFVRTTILRHQPDPRKIVPLPESRIYQIGDLILTKVDEVPPGAIQVESAPRPDGGIDPGGGYVADPSAPEE